MILYFDGKILKCPINYKMLEYITNNIDAMNEESKNYILK